MSNETYLDTIVIDGIDNRFAVNTPVDDITSSSVMIIDFAIDGSDSMSCYVQTMRECLGHYKQAICDSKQVDEMIVSKTVFNSTIQAGGYVLATDFNTDYEAFGCTRLYDTIINRRQSMLQYMEELQDTGFTARACLVLLTDGQDVGSDSTLNDARKAIQDLINREVTVAFIAFGQKAFGIADSLGIRKQNIIKVSNNESELRRVMFLVSKSAISASKKASAGASDADGGFFNV